VTEIIAAFVQQSESALVNGTARRTAARRALAPLALMVAIFALSAQPDLDSGLGVWDTILRKLVHAAEYCGLTVLWAWALAPVSRRPVPLAVSIALAYAVTDEYHQSFVEGRVASPVDIAIDAAGTAIGATLLRYHPRVRSAVETGLGGQ
jgi:VanZ family protein